MTEKTKPTGRPTTRTPEIVEAILAWVADGKTLAEFCRRNDVSRRSFYDWKAADPELAARFARARELGADVIAEEILAIADDGSNDTYVDDEGFTRTDHDVIARSRLRVDARLKLLAKWFPTSYGDKMQVGGAADLPPVRMTTEERAARISSILAAAAARRAKQRTDHGEGKEEGGEGRDGGGGARAPRGSKRRKGSS